MKRGQTALEYVYLIGILAAAIIVMLVYISRGFQGKIREQADQMGEQYSPTKMRTKTIETSIVTLNDTNDGTISTSKTSTKMTNKGQEKVVRPLSQEDWR